MCNFRVMKRNTLLVILLNLFLTYNLDAQQKQQGKALLRFDNKTWDVGHIPENSAKLTHTFRFINTHTAPIAIEKVVTTCGCTVPSYSKKPVMPNKEGYISVTFDPKGRANKFSKTLQIICNGGKSMNHLRVTGFVEPVLNPDTDFPYSLAFGVSADQLVLSYSSIQQNAVPKIVEAKLYNYSAKQATLSYIIENTSGCIKVDMPKVIMPQSVIMVKAVAVASKGFYGSFKDRIVLYVNGERSQALEVYGTVIDDMRGVSMLNGPKLKISSHSFELGRVRGNSLLKRTVKFTNEGKRPLVIRRIECDEEVRTEIKKEIILSEGETREIDFMIFPKRNKVLRANVKIVNNDPKKAIQNILFTGEVVEL